MSIILAKTGLMLLIAAGLSTLWQIQDRLSSAHYQGIAVACLAIKIMSSVTLFAFFGGEYLHSDPHCYFQQFNNAYAGAVTYRDYFSAYSPLFDYFWGLFYKVAGAPGFIISYLVLEWGIYLLTTELLVTTSTSPSRKLTIFVCLFFSPLSISYVLIEGQEDFLVLASLVVPLAVAKNKPLLSGFLFSAFYLITKALSIFSLPPLLLYSRGHTRKILAGVTLIPIVYLLFIMAGSDIMAVLSNQASQRSSGNLPYLAETFFQIGPAFWGWSYVCYFVLATVLFYVSRRFPSDLSVAILLNVILWCLFMLFAPKTLGAYYLSFFPLLFSLVAVSEANLLPALIWLQVPMAIHHTVYHRQEDLQFWVGPVADAIQTVLGLVLVAITIYLLAQAWRILQARVVMLADARNEPK